jgi:hypothetical protein
MPWEVENSSSTERLPVDSRFIAKVDRGATTKSEQSNSKFTKKWRSADEYSKSVNLNTEERVVYNYVADLVASGLTVDPVAIEDTLLNSSDTFTNKASNFYSQPSKLKLSEEGMLDTGSIVQVPAGSYVESILSKLQQKGLVRYA